MKTRARRSRCPSSGAARPDPNRNARRSQHRGSQSIELPSTLSYECKDHIAVITIDRPDALNSLTAEMLTGIEDAMRAFQKDPDLWVAVFTASGDKAFSSGLDLKEAAPC